MKNSQAEIKVLRNFDLRDEIHAHNKIIIRLNAFAFGRP